MDTAHLTRSRLATFSKSNLIDLVIVLAEQNAALRTKIERLEEQIADITEQNAQLFKQNVELEKANKTLAQRVEDLERRLGLNSSNSGKPPSSDGLSKPARKKRTRSLRGSCGRKSGGQPGHPGKTLRQTSTPEQIIDHYPHICPDCKHRLSGVVCDRYVRRQVFDLPPPPPLIVTEHRARVCVCPACGTRVQATFPAGVNAPVQYGDNLAAMASYLQTRHRIPDNRLAQIFSDLHGVDISAATLASLVARTAAVMRPVVNRIQALLCGPDVAVKHMDETGLRINGKTRWLHILCSPDLSHFRIGRSRGDVTQEVTGSVVHDNWASYRKIPGVRHALCNAHHLRELQALIDIEKEPWATEMRSILLDAKTAADRARDRNSRAVVPARIAAIERRYDACCQTAIRMHEALPPLVPDKVGKTRRGKPKRRIGHNLALRMQTRKEEVLLFLNDLSVPFTNNEAERDLRMTKVRQKVSGCFRTHVGAENFCTLRTVIETARKQGWSILETLRTLPDQLILNLKPC